MDVDENHVSAETEQRHSLKSAESIEPTIEQKNHLIDEEFVNGMKSEDLDQDNQNPVRSEEAADHSTAPSLQLHDFPPPLDCTSTLNENGDSERPPSLESSELSPTLRRSTRTACLKAQEKLRLKDGMVDSHAVENGTSAPVASTVPELPVQTTAAEAEVMESPQKKKRKLSAGSQLDQYDAKFGIRLDEDGDVVMMTDESDISSLTKEESTTIRQKFEETSAKLETSTETKREREYQVRELESGLLLAEAQLAILKKTLANQQLAARNANQDSARRFTSNVAQNSNGTAYKPPVVGPNPTRLNGTTNAAALAASKQSQRGRGSKSGTTPGPIQITPQQQQLLQRMLENNQLRPDMILNILQAMNPAAASALNPAARQQNQQREQQQREAQERERRQRAEQEAAAQRKMAEATAERMARENAQSAQQKIANARAQYRKIAEQKMLASLPQPKAPVSDLSFIPNAAQPDFLYLLGLDLVVQRNLKDKNVFKKVETDPYVCEECGTDFTPSWKAIAGEKGDLHLYCEQCLRQAQKRRVRDDRTARLKKLFARISEDEKEIERQIQSGKLIETLNAASTTTSSSTATKTEPKIESKLDSTSSIASKLASGLPPNFNAAALSSLINNVKNLPHSASSILNSASTSGGGSSGNRNSAVNSSINAASRSTIKQDPKKNTPTPSRKRGHNSSTSGSGSNSMNSQLAALANNNPAINSLMSQIQAVQALRQLNPNLLSSPQMMLQLYQNQQRMNQAATGNNANAMSQLMNYLSTSSQSQNHTNNSTTTSASHTSSNQQSSGGSSTSAANLIAHMSQANLIRHLASAGGNSSTNSATQNLIQQLSAAVNSSRKK
ncbi:P66-CC domain-containing protein [Aphelenchoides besseyi]|nr:P66-CC domain-containing protein [Aphelenchoides besseyi]